MTAMGFVHGDCVEQSACMERTKCFLHLPALEALGRQVEEANLWLVLSEIFKHLSLATLVDARGILSDADAPFIEIFQLIGCEREQRRHSHRDAFCSRCCGKLEDD